MPIILDDRFKHIRKCEYITDVMISTLLKYIKEPSKCNVAIEGYAYSRVGNSSSLLKECGGILKLKLLCAGFMKFDIVTPTALKKNFTGHGKATKLDMYKVFNSITCFGSSDLSSLFSIKSSKPLHPIEDIVDAFALCIFSMSKYKKNNKKRKIVHI
jgi:Holliday junction resolvasome RuvABC endonuclease subunit